ncbi:MAG: hypothetical protein HY243_17470 [Proteobacteria bacterium]|nr:hypothetical protein [Pseudomonadota bacterium]
MRKLMIVVAAAFAAQAANAAPLPRGTTPMPCRADAMGRALDFWVGDWTVTNVDGTKAGENSVEPILDGCAIMENWHGVDKGDDGESLFTYDARRKTWDQVWVTQDTTRPGGLKRKTLTGILYANAVRFEGKIEMKPGVTIIDRTTLTPWLDGRVRQTIEWSKDDGKTWKAVFDAYYNRKGHPDLGARKGGDPH